MAQKFAACLLNISAGVEVGIVERVSRAALVSRNVTVLNTFVDEEYNRSVITISGRLEELEEAILSASKTACSLIDLREHKGGHPRLGAVDLIPIHPLTEETSLEECGSLARRLGKRLAREVSGIGVFFFGTADGNRRGLAERRRELGWFKQEPKGNVDVGHPGPSFGVTGIGSIPYMANFNVSIETDSCEIGRDIVRGLRERSGGFLGVQAMAFPHRGVTEIACNVDMFPRREQCQKQAEEFEKGTTEKVMGELWRTKFSAIEDFVRKKAQEQGVNTVEGSTIIGFDPKEALKLTIDAIENGASWKSSLYWSNTHM